MATETAEKYLQEVMQDHSHYRAAAMSLYLSTMCLSDTLYIDFDESAVIHGKPLPVRGMDGQARIR